MKIVGLALLLAGLALPTAAAGPVVDPGLTSNSILLGGTVPLSGPAAAFANVAPGANALDVAGRLEFFRSAARLAGIRA